ncbi:hypothetical protein ACFVFI_09560 [Streptomyces sp. NPDC057705]|uniref:hypothetical protein n=1 Tax=Streptomyces sp. NPDC057705 TaxID=3346222 RepID=UPI0036CDDD36
MRSNIKRAGTVVGALAAAFAMLGQGVAQAAPISRTSSCATFSGDYTYWSDGAGWYGFSLSGRITRTCAGSGWHTLRVTGDKNWGDGRYYDFHSMLLDKGEARAIEGFGTSSGAKNIRITLVEG